VEFVLDEIYSKGITVKVRYKIDDCPKRTRLNGVLYNVNVELE